MLVAIFCTRVRPELLEEYQTEFVRLWNIAVEQPGFISSKFFSNDEGEAVAIQGWESAEHLRAWRDHPEHAEARRRGREDFYQDFTIYICDEPHKYEFFR